MGLDEFLCFIVADETSEQFKTSGLKAEHVHPFDLIHVIF